MGGPGGVSDEAEVGVHTVDMPLESWVCHTHVGAQLQQTAFWRTCLEVYEKDGESSLLKACCGKGPEKPTSGSSMHWMNAQPKQT